MRTIIALFLSAFALAGCQVKPNPAAYTDEIKLACGVASVGYAIWEGQYATKVKPDVAAKIRASYAGVASLCLNPPTSEAAAILAAVNAVNAFNEALAAAQAPK